MSQEKKETSKNTYKKGKKNKKTSIIIKLIGFAFVVISIMFYIAVVKLDMLPGVWLTIFTIAEIIFTFAITLALIKRHKTLKLNIFCLIVIIILSTVYILAMNYLFATSDFLDTVFSEAKETQDYYVVVKKNSQYNKIEELEGKELYLFKTEDDVKDEINKKVSVSYKIQDNLKDLGQNLIAGKETVILVSSTQYDILNEEIKDFKSNTKIIYTAHHEIKTASSISNSNSKYKVDSGIFNVYISGIDTAGNISNVARSDANIIATINANTHEVLLTSIPRDYYVTLHSYGAKDKLTHSGIYGINETVSTVEDLLGVEINYYVRVNFTTVIKLVDTLGGVDVYSDYDFTADTTGHHFNKGYNHVNGAQALAFSRERYSFASGDNQRVKNQQAVIEAIIKKVLNSTTLLTKYTSILNSLEGSFQTNIKQDEISSLVKGQLSDMSSWSIKTNALTGTGKNNPTYSMGSQLLYTMIPDSTSVTEAKEKINDVMGE